MGRLALLLKTMIATAWRTARAAMTAEMATTAMINSVLSLSVVKALIKF